MSRNVRHKRASRLLVMYSVSLCVCCAVLFGCIGIGPWGENCSDAVYSEEDLAKDIMRFGTKSTYREGEDGQMYEIEVAIDTIERVALDPSWLPPISFVQSAYADCDPSGFEEGSVSYTADVTVYRVTGANNERGAEVVSVSGVPGTYHGNDSEGPRRYELGEGGLYLQFLPSNGSNLSLYRANIQREEVAIDYRGTTPLPPAEYRDEGGVVVEEDVDMSGWD